MARKVNLGRPSVGIDITPIAFRSRAPGTAVHVENQARALLAMNLEWNWVVVATPRTLRDSPAFRAFDPIVVADSPLSYHACFTLGRVWKRAGCVLGLATAFFAPLIGPPVVTNYFDANSLHPVRDHRGIRRWLKYSVVDKLIGLSRARSRALFILSEYGRQRMVEHDPASATKWVVAPCGCPPLPPPGMTPPWATALQGRPFILYTGAFSRNKNQESLIKAWDRLRRTREDVPVLVLVGPIPNAFRNEVLDPTLAGTLRPNEVIAPGFISDEEVGWAYRHAHTYIQPSFAEGFGLPMVQAMSCGVPVACSDSTSLPEVAGSAAIFFNPAKLESITSALETLVFSPAVRDRLRAAGLERAKAFTWKRHAEIVVARMRHEISLLLGG